MGKKRRKIGNNNNNQPTLCGVCITVCVCECVKGGYSFFFLLFVNVQMKDVNGEGGMKKATH